MSKKKRALVYLGVTLFILICGVAAYVLKIHGIIKLNCPIHELTGLNCPGCGATRMVLSITNMHLYQAFRFNPLLFISIPFYIYMYIACGKSYIMYGRINDRLASYILYYAIILIVFGLIRNIGWFRLLSPTKL